MVNGCARVDIPCPACGRVNNKHGDGLGSVPNDGDYGICWACHTIAVFTDGGKGQRLMTPEEHREAMANPAIRQALAAMAESYTPSQAIELLA